jgi:hypothetical protein
MVHVTNGVRHNDPRRSRLLIINHLDIVPRNIASLALYGRVLNQQPIIFGVKHQQYVALVQG